MDGIKIVRLDDGSQQSWFQRFVLGRWLSKRPVFARSCRVVVEASESQELFRVTYTSTERDYATAERNAELEVGQLLADHGLNGRVLEVQWKRGRFVTAQTIRTETDSVRAILNQLRKDKCPVVINIEKIEGYIPRSVDGSNVTRSSTAAT